MGLDLEYIDGQTPLVWKWQLAKAIIADSWLLPVPDTTANCIFQASIGSLFMILLSPFWEAFYASLHTL